MAQVKFNEPIERCRYVLGDTLASYIFAYYNPQYILLKVSQDSQDLVLNDTRGAKALLNELNLQYSMQKSRNGILKEGSVCSVKNDSLVKEYAVRSRLCDRLDSFEYINLVCSEDNFLKFDFITFKKAIEKSIKTISINAIEKINLKKRLIVCDRELYYYSHLVVTMQRTKFLELCDEYHLLNYMPFTEFLVRSKKLLIPDGYDKLYDLDHDYHQIYRGNKSDYYILRYSGFWSKDKFYSKRPYIGLHIVNRNTKLLGYCYGNPGSFNNRRISFMGRFAEWSNFVTNNAVIKESIRFKGGRNDFN